MPIELGPLTSLMCNEGKWRAEDPLYPFWQCNANENERVLSFAESQHQLERYWSRLTAGKSQRDSGIDELRIAFHLNSRGFKITEWEPVGQNKRLGEYLVCDSSGVNIFVEAKGPRWEGELKPSEIQQGRTKQPKDVYCEARSVSPRKGIQAAVDKAYGKFSLGSRNLLVIVGYRGFVSLDDFPARDALYETRYSGCFSTAAYEKLGGVGFFLMGNDVRERPYEMRVFLNSFALEPLPDDFVRACGP